MDSQETMPFAKLPFLPPIPFSPVLSHPCTRLVPLWVLFVLTVPLYSVSVETQAPVYSRKPLVIDTHPLICSSHLASSLLCVVFHSLYCYGEVSFASSAWKQILLQGKENAMANQALMSPPPVSDNRWISVLTNSKEEALTMAFRGEQSTGENSLEDLTKAIIEDVQRLPGNDVCCDCGSSGICPQTWAAC